VKQGDGIFLLGTGAQKAGTTWLHSYLKGQPGVRLSPVKEWHVWDALTVPEFARFRAPQGRTPLRNLASLLTGRQEWRRRRRFFADPETYFDFFAAELRRPGVRLTADITPSYAALDVPTLQRIRDGFERREVPIKVVFLMRDPVERCWSHLKMLRQIGTAQRLVGDVADYQAYFPEFCRTDEAQLRTDYAAIIGRLREAFAEGQLHFGFFENMFEAGEIARLSAFLGLEARPEMGSVRVHAGKDRASLPTEIRAQARANLGRIYRETEALFPQSSALWARD
jgi:hypothetical protein